MKKIITLTALLGLAWGAHAQMSIFEVGSKEDRADRLYYQFSYASAISLYEAVLNDEPDNQRVLLRIADSYRMLNQPEESANWYARVIHNDTLIADADVLHYAEMLSGAGEYQQAKSWYEKYKSMAGGDDSRPVSKLDALENLEVYFKDSAMYLVEQASFNSQWSDFSPAFYEDGLVFVSSRETAEMRLTSSIFNWDKQPYLDLFYVGRDSAGVLSNPSPWNSKINTQYHEGPVAFFDGGDRVVFTRNNYFNGRFRMSSDKINKLQLYSAKVGGGDFQSLPFNSDEYSVGHPTFMADGHTMIFVSDMPGSVGGTDLWKSYWNGSEWSDPVNLGAPINTEGDEMFPYFHADGTLYFASNGRGGLGGLDLYSAKYADSQYQEPKNLGYPMNTRHDDFGLILDNTGVRGYFSSNRIVEEDDNIFRFEIVREPFLRISGIVVDDVTGDLLPNTTVHTRNSYGTEATVTSDEQARFTIDMEWDAVYRFTAEKELYEQMNFPVRTAEDTPEAREPLEIRMKNRCWEYAWALNDKETNLPVQGAQVTLIKRGTNDSLVLKSGDGIYILPMECEAVYDLRIEKEGYFTKTIEVSPGNIPEPEFEEIVVGKAIEVENIYYDLNKADIRADAAVELDKLVKLLVENPNISIELSSHTDSRGSDVYNLNLSQRRAESAVAYIIDQGISADRITAKGYGETKLNNDCANGVPCSDEDHQANRRTEFAVTEIHE